MSVPATQAKSRTAIPDMKFFFIPAVSAGILLATIALHAAQAQTGPAKVVTRDELRACMNSESELAVRRQAAEARNRQNRDEAAAIRVEQEQMAAEQKRIEENEGAMDKFNRRVKLHNARVQAAKAGADSFRADLETLNKALLAYNDQCGGITFQPQDKEAILKERDPAKN